MTRLETDVLAEVYRPSRPHRPRAAARTAAIVLAALLLPGNFAARAQTHQSQETISATTVPAAQAQTLQSDAPQTEAPQGPSAQPAAVPPASQSVRAPRELSPWSMFLSADNLVKAVMASLAFASLVTWTILLAKTFQLFAARRRVGKSLAVIGHARSLADAQSALAGKRDVVALLLAVAESEVRLSSDASSARGVRERAESRFAEIVRAEARVTRVGLGMLATIGSTAPFVGLFGTVWGIMNSFIGISKAQTTNLAVVAPGIAEALLATAIGLVAAIPAVIFYNHFSRQSKSYLELVGRAAGAAGRLLSRDLDRGAGGELARAAE